MSVEPTPDDQLASLVNALRAPVRADELQGMDATVDAMMRALQVTNGSTMMGTLLAQRRVSVMAAAGLLAFGSMAAAGAGTWRGERPSFADAPSTSSTDGSVVDTAIVDTAIADTAIVDTAIVDTAIVDTTIVDTTIADVTVDVIVDATVVDTSAPVDTSIVDATMPIDDTMPADTTVPGSTPEEESEVGCADGNHGKTVSSVAQSVPPGPGHGEAVTEAATGDCGKNTPDASADAESHPAKPDNNKPGNNKPSNGKGEGKGKP